jgi:hypothetical protein
VSSQIETDPHAHGGDHHALPHPPDPAEVRLELELQRAREHLEIRGFLDLVQAGQAIECPLDPFGGTLLF